MKETLRTAAVQFESKPADKAANFRNIELFAGQAAAQNVRLIVFPECCVTGYWFIRNLSLEQLAALAEPVPEGQSTRRLTELARRHGLSIGAGLGVPLNELREHLLKHYDARYDIHPRKLEELVADIFRNHGHRVELTSFSKDGGIDLFLFLEWQLLQTLVKWV